MKKFVLITYHLALIVLCINLVNAYSMQGHVVTIGWAYNAISYVTGPVEIIYDYSYLMENITNESRLRLCRWDETDLRWYGLKATHDTINKEFRYTTDDFPQIFALREIITTCEEDNRGHCHAPYLERFTGAETSTITNETCSNVYPLTLQDDSGSKIIWLSTIDACGEYYNDDIIVENNSGEITINTRNILIEDDFVSLKIENLNENLNSSANVTLVGIDCNNFSLYYAKGYYTTAAEIMADGIKVADQNNLYSDCIDSSICKNLACSNGKLTFEAQHFDSFAGIVGEYPGNGEYPPIPEFSTLTLVLAIIIVIIGAFIIKNRKK